MLKKMSKLRMFFVACVAAIALSFLSVNAQAEGQSDETLHNPAEVFGEHCLAVAYLVQMEGCNASSKRN